MIVRQFISHVTTADCSERLETRALLVFKMAISNPLMNDGTLDTKFIGHHHFVNIIVVINELFHFWKEFFFHAFLAKIIRRVHGYTTVTFCTEFYSWTFLI